MGVEGNFRRNEGGDAVLFAMDARTDFGMMFTLCGLSADEVLSFCQCSIILQKVTIYTCSSPASPLGGRWGIHGYGSSCSSSQLVGQQSLLRYMLSQYKSIVLGMQAA